MSYSYKYMYTTVQVKFSYKKTRGTTVVTHKDKDIEIYTHINTAVTVNLCYLQNL
jgi:hypothetical protein